jgi:hypothetical protein
MVNDLHEEHEGARDRQAPRLNPLTRPFESRKPAESTIALSDSRPFA